jgi:sugar lactone lactonase YvrE
MAVASSIRLILLLVVNVSVVALSGSQSGRCAEPTVEVVIGPRAPDPGEASQSPLNTPFAVCFEPDAADGSDGAMWIVEYEGGRLLRLGEDGRLKHIAGDGLIGYADGSALSASFNKLHNVARLSDGRLVMSDHRNHAIRCYDPETELVSTLSGSGASGFSGDGGPAAAARFDEPICVEVTPDLQSLLIADIRNHRIRRIDLATQVISTVAGNGKKGTPESGAKAIGQPLNDPRAAIADGQGGYYVLDRSGNQLLQIDQAGILQMVAGSGEAGLVDGPALDGALSGPKHLCLGINGEVYIADDNNDAVRVYDPESKQLSTVDLGPYKLKRPHGVAVRGDWLYIADSYHNRILKVQLERN